MWPQTWKNPSSAPATFDLIKNGWKEKGNYEKSERVLTVWDLFGLQSCQ